MDAADVVAIVCLLIALAYLTWSFRQSVPIPYHRQLTLCGFLLLAIGFWLWGERVEFLSGFGGFVVGWLYMGVRSAIKAEHLFGKEVAHYLTEKGL